MNNEIYCYEPFAHHNSLSNTWYAAFWKSTRTTQQSEWLFEGAIYKTKEQAEQAAQNYIDKVLLDKKEG